MRPNRWSEPQLDRRSYPRAEYRRTAPALLELEGYRCAVRDLAPGGLRVEPAPAGRVWEVGERVTGILHLRTVGRLVIDGVIGRIDRSGLALVPDDGPWPESSIIDAERSSLVRWHHEWWNGSGYPDMRAFEDIPVGARILRAVELCAALLSDRLVLLRPRLGPADLRDQQRAAHADQRADPRVRHVEVVRRERVDPRVGVGVVAVDQRAIDVEQDRGVSAHPEG